VIRIAERLIGGIPVWGTFHFANAGATSRTDFTEAMLRMAGLPTRVEPIQAAEWMRPARRPANAVLDCTRLQRVYGIEPRDWREALAELLPVATPQSTRVAAARKR
jgi:dTDP-4-dehydrorhamnose reductase